MAMTMTMTMKIIMIMIMEHLSASEITPNIQRMLTNMKFESAAWVTSCKKGLVSYI